jgi:hypothetical protein
MKSARRLSGIAGFVALNLLLWIGGPARVASAPFPDRGDDLTSSLGQFRIFVDPTFQPLLAGFPDFDGERLDSPILFDPGTTIGRSAPHLEGSAEDANGTPVGSPGAIVADRAFSLIATGFEAAGGTREVHTQIIDFDLGRGTGGVGPHVRAGISAPNSPSSVGEVESLSGNSGDQDKDFPAQSFFDIFVEVDIPGFAGFPGGTLYNKDPLLVTNGSIQDFPPRVVYVHGNSSAVPIFFRDDSPGYWNRDDRFGYLILGGHGVGFTEAEAPEFENEMAQEKEMLINEDVRFRRGDSNSDGKVDISDAIATLGFLFTGDPPVLSCHKTADADDGGQLDISDGVYILSFLFLGTAAPLDPFPGCGHGASSDPLPCDSYDKCP